MKTKKEIEKPRGWANLQQQLKEVREESFKQGVWKGKSDKEKEMLDKFEEMIDEKIKYQEELMKQAHGKEEILNVCECIIIELENLIAKIKGGKE